MGRSGTHNPDCRIAARAGCEGNSAWKDAKSHALPGDRDRCCRKLFCDFGRSVPESRNTRSASGRYPLFRGLVRIRNGCCPPGRFGPSDASNGKPPRRRPGSAGVARRAGCGRRRTRSRPRWDSCARSERTTTTGRILDEAACVQHASRRVGIARGNQPGFVDQPSLDHWRAIAGGPASPSADRLVFPEVELQIHVQN